MAKIAEGEMREREREREDDGATFTTENFELQSPN